MIRVSASKEKREREERKMTYRLPYRKPIESIPYDEFYSALEPNHAPTELFPG